MAAALWLLPLLLAFTGLTDGSSDVTMGVSYDDVTDLEGVVKGCVEGGARGEDGVNYCRKMTPEEQLKLKTAAEGN